MAHVNVAAIVATCMTSLLQQQQQQQQPASSMMLLYAIDSTDCHNLKLFLQRCRVAQVSYSSFDVLSRGETICPADGSSTGCSHLANASEAAPATAGLPGTPLPR